MMRTWLTERFGLTVPVIAAPMARAGGAELAGAVSAAGGLGMIGAGGGATPEWMRTQAKEATAGGHPYGIGLLAWVLDTRPDQVETVLELRPALVSVSFGDYGPHVRGLADAGIPVTTQVGTVAEALAAQDAGLDFLVVRGGEGGGHGRNDAATLPLLQAVLDAVELPVVAAGGIGTGRGLAAVLAAGAAGAWVGTAFLACDECLFPGSVRERIVHAAETATAYGRVFDVAHGVGGPGGWPPQYGGRALRNRFFDTWDGREDELATDDGARTALAEAQREGDVDLACVYAGQAVGTVARRGPAADVVAELATAEDHLRRAAALAGG
jgi:nitronate monooxygenase